MAKYCKKFPLAVKLFIMLMLYSVVGTYAAAYSQEASVNLGLQECTVSELLKTLEKQTGYKFFFNNSHIDTTRRVSVDTNGKDIFDILDKVFTGTNVTYSKKNMRIIFSVKEEQTVRQTSSHIISGVVTDESGEAIIGASVVEKGTTNGTITDIDGKFSLQLRSEKAQVEISYIGYQPQTIKYTPGQTPKVILKEDAQTLQEVVIVGFGSQKKANLTGAVAQVKMDDVLGDRPVTNVKDALQGSMPGLTVSGSGSPGASKTFNIRGTVSINSTNPLVLIDNVEGDIDLLNPEDIESVSVLKDAASSAIYGARAAAGVILITTKKAKKGEKFKLNYNNNFGFQTSINQPKQVGLDTYFQAYQDAGFPDTYYANSQSVTQWREYLAEYKKNPSAFNTVGDGIYVDESGIPYFLNEHNPYASWLETSFMQTHNATLSGGTEKLRYRISGGLTYNDGPLVESKDTYNRKNLSAFIGAEINKWYTQEVDVRFTDSDRKTPNGTGSGIYRNNILSWMPEGIMPASVNTSTETDISLDTPANNLKYNNPTESSTGNTRIFLKSIITPLKGLELVGEYTYDRKDINSSRYANQWTYTTYQMGSNSAQSNGDYLNMAVTKQDYNALNLYGSYGLNLNEDHHFKVMAGFNQERQQTSYQTTTAYEMVSSAAPSLGGGTGQILTSSSYTDFATRGAFYRINYNYKDKYMIETNGRYDGSSKFPKNSRFGFFPSVSLGWNVAKENFMRFSENWLNEFKVRASWGQIGNQNISSYQYYAQMSPLTGGAYNSSTSSNNPVYWLQDGAHVTYLTAPNLISSSFTWEKVETLDFGFDLSMLNNRLKATFDWYKRTTKDMLQSGVDMPAVIGANAPMQNIADMETKGWEVSLTWRDKIGDWNYNIGLNLYDHKSKITKFINEKGTLTFNNETGGTLGTNTTPCYYAGQTLGEIWGYVSDGYYTIDDFVDATSWQLKDGVVSVDGVNPRPGDMKFKNLSDKTRTNQINKGGDSLDDPGDRKVIGNTTPRYCYGINLGIGYKGFNLSAMLQGVGKRDYWIGGYAVFPFGGTSNAYNPLFVGQNDYWQPQGDCGGLYTETDMEYWVAKKPDASLFRVYNQLNNVNYNTRVSDKYLQNAAYMRLKNVTLSYTFPTGMIQKWKLSGLRLFVSGENLATFSSLPDGYDPERLSWGYPFYRTVSFGLNITL